MAKKEKNLPDLSQAEWEIMKVIWKDGPMAARDVYSQLSKSQKWTNATIRTFLRRMVQKGWLNYQQVGNSYLYRSAVSQDKAVGVAIKDFSQRVLDGVLSPFVAYFVEQENLSAEDIGRLEQILENHRRKKGRKDGNN